MISKKNVNEGIPDVEVVNHLCVSVDFDVDASCIISLCPAHLYHLLGKRKYKKLMFMISCMACNMEDYLDYKENIYVKSKKSKKK